MASKILVIEDEDDIRNLIAVRLRAEGHEVITAADGLEGLEAARNQGPDLIVCDVMLPRMDGYRLCRMLKFDENYAAIPVIILTARGQESDRQAAEDIRADAYMKKPFDGKVLSDTIRDLLGKVPGGNSV